MAERTIVAVGGWEWEDEACARRLQDFLLARARGSKVCYVPTAAAERAEAIVSFYEQWAAKGELSHLSFFPWPPADLRGFALRQDLLVISGGNTANMLAIWRVHGFDQVLREAWDAGVVLTGWSAGMICWFEAGVTDSFGPELDGMRDGLAFLSGSACPHYDSEERRRPAYRDLVGSGFPPGYAADDCVALHFAGTELAEVVTAREGAAAYRVDPGREERLEPRLLP
jgi:peptidase E